MIGVVQRTPRPLTLATTVVAAALTLTTLASPAHAAPTMAADPGPLLPAPESLLTEGISIEGPLINNLGLRQLI